MSLMHKEIIPRVDRQYPWGEVSFRKGGPSLKLAHYDDSHHTLIIGLIFVAFYIKVRPFLKNAETMETAYGFSFCNDALHINWGNKTKLFYYPWAWDFHKRWEMCEKDGCSVWVEFPKQCGLSGPNYGDLATKETFDYQYTRRSGEVQKRKATVAVDRMEWRWKCLKWLPFPRKVSTSIWVNFDDEVGERSGSWKGGVMGCGEEMRPGESPWETLKRMERDRVFR